MKVGKAIYNILSRAIPVQQNIGFSTDTFAPSGEELVTNGDFSATGSELVTNGDFSATGTELAVALTSWTPFVSGTSTVTYDGSTAKLNIDSSNSNVGIFQDNIFTVGKSYKIVLRMKATASFDAEIVEANNAATVSTIGTASLTTSYQNFTFYFTATGTFDLFIHRLFNGGGASKTIFIESASVKELGAGWTDSGNPLKAASFNANGLTIKSVNGNGNNNRVSQANVTEDAKSYKVTYTIYARTLTGTNVLQYYNGSTYVVMPTTIIGTAQTFYFTRLNTDDNWYFRITLGGSTTDFVTIGSISVKEVGEGWTVGGGWSIGDNKAVADGSRSDLNTLTQGIGLVANKSYKISFNSKRDSGDLFVREGGFNTIFTLNTGTAAATNVFYITLTGSSGVINFYAYNYGGTITNISVQEMVLTKIFPEIAPPDIDPPYIVYSVVSNQPSNTKNENGEIDEASLEVYSFQDTYNKTVDLGVAVRASLDRVNGTFATVKVDSINYTNEQMDVNESRKLWAAIQDYTVRIKNI